MDVWGKYFSNLYNRTIATNVDNQFVEKIQQKLDVLKKKESYVQVLDSDMTKKESSN